jgi:hypothetical protein
MVLFLIGSGVLLFDVLKQMLSPDITASTASVSSVQSATITVFRTPYFQFQADKSWREVSVSDSGPDKFVYRSYNGLLVQHELIVEVNRDRPVILDNTQTTRVLPVVITEDHVLSTLGEISPHCQTLVPKNDRAQQFVSYENTSFPCNPDGLGFVVVVATKDSGTVIRNAASDGSIRSYQITYRDSTSTPTGRPLASIVNTFQLFTK